MIETNEETLLPTTDVKPIPIMQMEFDADFYRSFDIVLKNPLHEKFAQLIVQGKSATEAYDLAHKFCKPGKEISRKTCTERGCKLLSNNDVDTRIKQLHRAVTQKFVMSDLELHKHLTEIIRNKNEKTGDRINAIKLLAQIKGLAKGDAEVYTSQHFVNLQVEVVDKKVDVPELQVIEGK